MTDIHNTEMRRATMTDSERLEALVKVCQSILERHAPVGTKKYCYLCETSYGHLSGCIYQLLQDAITQAKKENG